MSDTAEDLNQGARVVLWHAADPSIFMGASTEIWLDHAASLFTTAGALATVTLSTNLVGVWNSVDIFDVMELTLSLQEAAAAWSPNPIPLSLAVTCGDVSTRNGALHGAPIDQAHRLSAIAPSAVTLVSDEARQAAAARYLFTRFGDETSAFHAFAVDPEIPRRVDTRSFAKALGAGSMASAHNALLRPFLPLFEKSTGHDTLLIEANSTSRIRNRLSTLAEDQGALVLWISPAPGGLEPLGALRLALAPHYERIESADGLETLCRIAQGAVVAKRDLLEGVCNGLKELAGDKRPWVIVDSPRGVDVATLGLLERLEKKLDFLFIARTPQQQSLPLQLATIDWERVIFGTPDRANLLDVVRQVLGPQTSESIIEHITTVGGESALGVIEAARTFVAEGELILEGDHFRWRTEHLDAVDAAPLDKLMMLRAATLDDSAHRMLEAIASSPRGTEHFLAEVLAEADGLDASARKNAIERLVDERFISSPHKLGIDSEILRAVLVRSMPEARRAELSRGLAEALVTTTHFSGPFASALVSYYLAQGERKQEAAEAMLVAARAAIDAKMFQAGRRLASAAVQQSPSKEVRIEAIELARRTKDQENEASQQGKHSERTVTKILEKAFDEVDDELDLAIADGCSLSSVYRLRALVSLRKGDIPGAFSMYSRARKHVKNTKSARAKSSIALAWILLHDGDHEASVRAALAALANARSENDERGQRVALETMSAIYRALGRDSDANSLIAT